MITIRPAREADLGQVFDVFYQHEVGDDPNPPPKGDVLPGFRHELATGSMVLAEEHGRVLGFATVMVRGRTAYLAELFVRPEAQSSSLGTALLRRVFPTPTGDEVRFTVSSTDFRAVSLYVRAGLRPLWPNFLLQANSPATERLPEADVDVVEARPGDPDIARWDAEISGRLRAVDHDYWARTERGVPLWFRRGGDVVGYGYVRPGARSLWHPELTEVGPVGARTEGDALACVAAAVRRAAARGRTICIDVPGPHPGLAPLLEARFRITYVETFLADGPVFAPRLYVGSGDWLL